MILSPNIAGRIVPDGPRGCRYDFAKSVKSSMFRAGQPDNQSLIGLPPWHFPRLSGNTGNFPKVS